MLIWRYFHGKFENSTENPNFHCERAIFWKNGLTKCCRQFNWEQKRFYQIFCYSKNVDFFVENGGRFEHKKSALQPRFDGDN